MTIFRICTISLDIHTTYIHIYKYVHKNNLIIIIKTVVLFIIDKTLCDKVFQ